MKHTYGWQLAVSVGIILLFNVLTTVLKHWVFHSIGFCLCGLIWIIHPVLPGNKVPTKKEKTAIYNAGIILILIGIFSRAYYY